MPVHHGAYPRIEGNAAEILEPCDAHALEIAVEWTPETLARFFNGKRRANQAPRLCSARMPGRPRTAPSIPMGEAATQMPLSDWALGRARAETLPHCRTRPDCAENRHVSEPVARSSSDRRDCASHRRRC
jgi:hypothetical protein